MAHPAPLLDQHRLRETLISMLDCVMPACAHIEYRLVGTGVLLMHGIKAPAADVDLLVKRREEVDAFGAALASCECLIAPAWLPEARQYYGSYRVNGAEVEISTVEIDADTDFIETFGRGPWEFFVSLSCGSYTVPVVALELRLITELSRNRPDRYEPIISYMQANGCDFDFIQRGMETTGLPQDLQTHVLTQLKNASRTPMPRFKPTKSE